MVAFIPFFGLMVAFIPKIALMVTIRCYGGAVVATIRVYGLVVAAWVMCGAVPDTDRMAAPTPAELAAAYGKTIPDVIAPGLRLLFAGINPGLWSGATGLHFARPGNRFWPALAASGLTPRLLQPAEQQQLLDLGLGITNVVARASARADELTPEEFQAGGRRLVATVRKYRPRWLAVVGITAYRAAFDEPKAKVGEQPRTIGETRIWVLPNPSGLNAHWSAAALADEFARLKRATESAGH